MLDEDEFLRYVYKFHNGDTKNMKYIIESMFGIGKFKKVPKLLRKRMMCKLRIAEEFESYFFFKPTEKNNQSIQEIKKSLSINY